MRILLILFVALLLFSCSGCRHSTTGVEGKMANTIVITSTAFKEGEMIPVQYTCDGKSMSPPLAWSNVPAHTVTCALIVDDPDAPMGTFVHWVLFNIPGTTTHLAEHMPAENTYPDGAVSGINSARKTGYTPPCPPSGTHRYYFKLYALDTKLELKPGSSKEDLEKAMEGHILAQGQLMGRYQRKK